MKLRAGLTAVVAAALALACPTVAPAATSNERIPLPRTISQISPELFEVTQLDVRPERFSTTARQVIRIANSLPDIQDVRREHPGVQAVPTLFPLETSVATFWIWDIQYKRGDQSFAEAQIGPTGGVIAVNKGIDVGWPLVRGYPGVLGGILNRPYLWLPLCLLFIAPFFDPRRPFRLLHLDLLVLLGFGVSQYYFNRGEPDTSVALVYPVLAYIVVRLLLATFRPVRRDGPLVPWMGTRLLAVLLVGLVVLRVAFGIFSSQTLDVSYAGVVGADRVVHGEELYTDNDVHADTYGPVNYLAYVPFESLFPYKPSQTTLPAAKAATLTFDLLVMLALFVLGRRLARDGPRNRTGLALALAWAAYPYTSLTIASNTNDALVPLFVLGALLAVTSAPARGVMLGLATMTKFAPAVVAPALAAGTRRLRLRDALLFSAGFLALSALVLLPVLPDGGFREFWNTTLGFQLGRSSPLAIWDRHPSLDWLQTVLKLALVVLAVAVAFVPRRRTVPQLAAICGALFALAQMTTNYWIYFYAVWLLPFAMLAFAGEHSDQPRDPRARTASTSAKPGPALSSSGARG
ncbi:MAG TPA: glycosyltransferase 87 family protein [Thermoleophilaceae bacterium]|nr:glycosyltransferase 87 family protein [Thermoleophilaceae bacterium]